jgi:hypothetical protein
MHPPMRRLSSWSASDRGRLRLGCHVPGPSTAHAVPDRCAANGYPEKVREPFSEPYRSAWRSNPARSGCPAMGKTGNAWRPSKTSKMTLAV